MIISSGVARGGGVGQAGRDGGRGGGQLRHAAGGRGEVNGDDVEGTSQQAGPSRGGTGRGVQQAGRGGRGRVAGQVGGRGAGRRGGRALAVNDTLLLASFSWSRILQIGTFAKFC